MTDYSKVRALIITGVGLNCEKETADFLSGIISVPERSSQTA